MEDIKTVAEKVIKEMFGEVDDADHNELTEFASRLLAELQKDATPVAWRTSDGRMLIFADVLENNLDTSTEGMTPLYPHPKAATVPEDFLLLARRIAAISDAADIYPVLKYDIELARKALSAEWPEDSARAIQHAELPGIVICKRCRDAAQSEGEQK